MYKNKEGYKYLSDYIVENPKPSVEAGTYDDEVKPQFTESSSSTIYYTQDKSEPTEKVQNIMVIPLRLRMEQLL